MTKTLTSTLVALSFLAAPAGAETTIVRDAGGKQTGRIVTDARGSAILQNAQGQATGRLETRPDGSRTVRDAEGREVGRVGRHGNDGAAR